MTAASKTKRVIPKRVLIVEDDPTQLAILQELFTQEGFQVETASRGEQAKKILDVTSPDLVVLDAVLPQFDGLRLLNSVAESATPVFIITGFNHILGTSCYENGAAIVFRKPFDPKELIAAAKRHLTKPAGETTRKFPQLTERETQVLKLIAEGNSTHDVAKLLNISVATVFVFRKNIKRKFGGMSFIQICAKYRV